MNRNVFYVKEGKKEKKNKTGWRALFCAFTFQRSTNIVKFEFLVETRADANEKTACSHLERARAQTRDPTRFVRSCCSSYLVRITLAGAESEAPGKLRLIAACWAEIGCSQLALSQRERIIFAQRGWVRLIKQLKSRVLFLLCFGVVFSPPEFLGRILGN